LAVLLFLAGKTLNTKDTKYAKGKSTIFSFVTFVSLVVRRVVPWKQQNRIGFLDYNQKLRL